MKLTTTLIAIGFTLLATSALADSIHQSGAGNEINSNSQNSYINSGNTSVNSGNTSGSNNRLSATGGKAHSNSVAVGTGFSDSSASSDNSVSISHEAQRRNPVSSAWSAPLAVGSESCMGSSSAGGQGVGFGLSVGTTWHDKECERRKNATQLWNMKKQSAAIALMCQNEAVAEAMETAGTPCPVRLAPAAGKPEQVAAGNTDVVYEYPGRR